MEDIVVLSAATLLMGFIAWWFFGSHEKEAVEAKLLGDTQEAEVVVDGGYTPNTVVLQKDTPATLVFRRKDPSGCFDEVVFPDFGIREELPVNQDFAIAIDTSVAGEYQYACGMNMFHGKVVVR